MFIFYKVCTHVRLESFAMSLCVYDFFLYRVCTHVRLGIFEMILCVYVYFVVEGMYTCKTGNFWKRAFKFMFVLVVFELNMFNLIFSLHIMGLLGPKAI